MSTGAKVQARPCSEFDSSSVLGPRSVWLKVPPVLLSRPDPMRGSSLWFCVQRRGVSQTFHRGRPLAFGLCALSSVHPRSDERCLALPSVGHLQIGGPDPRINLSCCCWRPPFRKTMIDHNRSGCSRGGCAIALASSSSALVLFRGWTAEVEEEWKFDEGKAGKKQRAGSRNPGLL